MSNSHVTLLKEAKRLIEMNKLDKAKIILQPMVIDNSNNFKIFSLLGYIYHKEGFFSRAIRNYQKAIELNNEDMESMINLSLVYNDLGRYQEGAELYIKATELFGKSQNSDIREEKDSETNLMFSKQHANLGEMYLRYNRAKEALDEFEKAIILNPDDYSFLVDMADCFSRLGKRKLAIKKLRLLKNKKPTFMEARIRLGHFLYLEGELGSAIEEWDEVLSEDPDNVEARLYIKMANQEDIRP